MPATVSTITQPYAYQVAARDPQSLPLTYSLVDGPPNMTIDPVTGLVSWTPVSA